jgi:hypothetical protein
MRGFDIWTPILSAVPIYRNLFFCSLEGAQAARECVHCGHNFREQSRMAVGNAGDKRLQLGCVIFKSRVLAPPAAILLYLYAFARRRGAPRLIA